MNPLEGLTVVAVVILALFFINRYLNERKKKCPNRLGCRDALLCPQAFNFKKCYKDKKEVANKCVA